ncbi:unnamed protein product [Schistosoma curassoni]|uniref:Uncharacterized protein n=1 Tax=Schistosoma curassoni TaxID=6186 RepID=A0A183KNE5_9TREM|nr:unnamed protein product [Schistosoma curassoni]
MLDPGSFAGKTNSLRPQFGPELSRQKSLDNRIKAVAVVLKQPLNCNKASWPARAANLFSTGLKTRSITGVDSLYIC